MLAAAAQGTLRLVTLAPEEPGNERAVTAVAATGAIVSLGHSGASYDQALIVVAHGARMATHFQRHGSRDIIVLPAWPVTAPRTKRIRSPALSRTAITFILLSYGWPRGHAARTALPW